MADDLQGQGVGTRLVGLILELACGTPIRARDSFDAGRERANASPLTQAGHPVLADGIDAGVEEIVLDPGAAQPIAA